MIVFLSAICAMSQTSTNVLVAGFQNPPASARPHTWWHWMGGNVSREGITADLEAMKAAGIGGAHIFDAGQGIPVGPVKYNSPEWRSLMSFAFHEGKRLGLDMTMHNCSGWSSSGGPWVKPDDAMKRITSSTTNVAGGTSITLAKPATVLNYYKDLAVYAFPATSAPGKTSFNELTGLGPNPGAVVNLNWPTVAKGAGITIPVSSVAPDGKLNYSLPTGNWTVLRIGVTLTGARNVASRESGEGLEVDKLSRASLDRYFAGGLDQLFKVVGRDSALHTVLIDSYETGYNNWTPAILSEFKTRRGYDATPYLPTLAGYQIGNTAETLGFLFDYRRTLAELWSENYSGYFAQKLAKEGLGLAVEPYGNGNFDPFTYGKPASLIMGEYWVGESPINPSVKVASSVAHVYDHSVVGAEALTASPGQAGWRNQPRQWKPFADIGMTQGINRIIYHRFAHQPWVSGVNPGMTMGPWGSHVDRTNTIWPYMLTWNTYLSRSQFMLQSGHSANDILLFAGEDAPQSYSGEGQDLPAIPVGFDYDFCGLDPIMSLTVRNHRVMLPNGVSYSVLVLPKTDRMSVQLAKKIRSLIDAGATVLGSKPTATPSLSELNHGGNQALQATANAIWGPGTSAMGSRRVGAGRIIWGQSVEKVLTDLHLAPDFVASSKDVHAIHRRYGTTDAYFVASSRPYPNTVVCKVRHSSSNVRVQLWHPETGKIEDAPAWSVQGDQISIPLQLDCTESVFVVLRPGTGANRHVVSSSAEVTTTGAKLLPALHIISATYGDPSSGKTVDVSRILRAAVEKSSLRIVASNGEMGGDPIYGVPKFLFVTYELGGVTKTVTIPENGTLALGNLPEEGTPPNYQLTTQQLLAWSNGSFTQTWSDGRKTTRKVTDLAPPVAINGPWQVRFASTYDPPRVQTFDKLQSWTDSEDFDTKYFSGTGTYTRIFDIPALRPGNRLYLDLGDVRELCRIRINKKPVATLWKAPFRVDITDFVKAGSNALEVDVTNLWTNRLIGDEQFPDDMGWNGDHLSAWPQWFVNHQPRPEPRRKTFTTWRHNFKDTPLLPSGLLGPVVLRSVKVIPLR